MGSSARGDLLGCPGQRVRVHPIWVEVGYSCGVGLMSDGLEGPVALQGFNGKVGFGFVIRRGEYFLFNTKGKIRGEKEFLSPFFFFL